MTFARIGNMAHRGIIDGQSGDAAMARAMEAKRLPLDPRCICGMNPPAPFHQAYALESQDPIDVTQWLIDKIGNAAVTLDDNARRHLTERTTGPLQDGERLRDPGDT